MSRVRTRPINRYVLFLMELYNAETIKDLALSTGIPYETLRRWSDVDGSHQAIEAFLDASAKTKRPVEEIMRGLLLGEIPKDFQPDA